MLVEFIRQSDQVSIDVCLVNIWTERGDHVITVLNLKDWFNIIEGHWLAQVDDFKTVFPGKVIVEQKSDFMKLTFRKEK